MGKIVSFANQKGGVGKTTTCINLAAYLASFGKKVLVVDMDPQGNATSGLGVEKSQDLKTLYDAIDGEEEIQNIVKKTNFENLFIVPATVDLAGSEIELVSMPEREHIVKNILNKIKEEYDYLLVDCPPSLGLLTVNALTACDSVLIPIQCEFFALEGLSQLMNTIKLVKKHLNPNIDVEGVILTMKDNRSNLIQQVSHEIQHFFGEKVYKTAIPRSIRLAEAPSHGKPILDYDAKGKGGVAYQELAKEFLQRNKDSYRYITK
jgi:chromosome partitioning protein